MAMNDSMHISAASTDSLHSIQYPGLTMTVTEQTEAHSVFHAAALKTSPGSSSDSCRWPSLQCVKLLACMPGHSNQLFILTILPAALLEKEQLLQYFSIMVTAEI